MNLDDIRRKYGLGTGEDKTNNTTRQNQSSTSRTKSSLEELRKKHGVGRMTDEQLDAAGVGADLIRLSCGLENLQDLLDDIAQALENV